MTPDRLEELVDAVILAACTHSIMVRLPSGEERFLLFDTTQSGGTSKGFYHESTEAKRSIYATKPLGDEEPKP